MRARIVLILALAAATVVPAAAAMPGSPLPDIPPPDARAAVQDDLLQITLDRLVAEAPLFGGFATCYKIINSCDVATYAQISVIRLDSGAHAEVNGEAGQVSLSSAKALWVAMAVAERGAGAVAPYAPPIFQKSDNAAAGSVIDLLGAPPSGGIDAINSTAASWGLDDTWLHGWYNGRTATTPYPAGKNLWGINNYTTPDDLATFWAMLGRGELLGAGDTARVLEWAALPRASEAQELITNRLPAAVAAEVSHKSGWRAEDSNRRIDAGLVTTPGGVTYAVALSFKATSTTAFNGSAADWARYASCEVYNLVADADQTCTRAGDPASIVHHTTAPIGSLNAVDADQGQVRVRGWALDRDAGAGPIDVRVSVDGRTTGTVTADRLKTSIQDRYHLGNYHGFNSTLAVKLSGGSHRVCATAVNDSADGGDRSIGCLTVTVPADHLPTGKLQHAGISPDVVIAWGWAKDADTSASIDVKLTLDGAKLKRVTADRGAGAHGFKLRVHRTVAPGEHRICALALNYLGAGPDRSIGCQTVTVPDDWPPTGILSTASVAGDGSTVRVKGRAWDPDAEEATEVRVEVDGTAVGSLLADRGPTGRAYDGTFPTALTPGDHQVCTFGLSPGGGDPTTQLGCATVTVPGS